MKYKVGDIVKVVNPEYTLNSDGYKDTIDRIVIIISYVEKSESKLENYDYKVKFIDGKSEPRYSWDYTYMNREIIRISREEAMLEIL